MIQCFHLSILNVKEPPPRSCKDKVPEAEKRQRLKELQALQDRHTQEKNTELEGSVQELLVEGRSKNSEQDMMGRTRSWKIVNFKGEPELIGKLVNVEITRGYLHSLRGKMIDHEGGWGCCWR